MKLRFAIFISVVLAATWAIAQGVNISGTWNAETISPRGKSEQTITFQQTGNTFTGEMVTSQGTKEPIKDGIVKGEDIEFNVERRQPTGETAPVAYKGKVTGDEITGTFTGATGRRIDWAAKRAGTSNP